MSTPTDPVVCVVSPNEVDAKLAATLLTENGLRARSFSGLPELSPVLDESSACLVIVEEALIAADIPALQEALSRLPPWLDLPLIVVSGQVAVLGTLVGRAFPDSGNVTLLERPLNPLTLLSAVQVAMRATARQRELGELLAQREQAVSNRDEFLAMLAHELRNPLAPMRNALYLMRMAKSKEPQVVQCTEILERQVNHVVRMVDDLMDVARLERGKVVLKKQRLDFNRLVASAVESCLPAAQQKGHRVNVRFGTDALPVEADAVRIEQIVCNLLNNAIKFSSDPGEIRVETSVQEGCAVASVEDRGIGFDPRAAGSLFDPFMQVNPTIERTAGGLGMGLTIVRRLVELHGGTVLASSAGPGKGARFAVRIPLAAGEVQADAAAPPQARGAAKARRIVLVEDNADIRDTFRAIATHWGHEVALAPDGPSGLALILKNRPDIALVDIGLPGMSGYDVAREVRKVMPNGAIQLVALTGYGQASDREQALRAGFDSHLLKPITPELLQRVLSEGPPRQLADPDPRKQHE